MPVSQTDHQRLKAMSDAEIDFTDLPEVPLEAFAQGVVRKGLKPVPKKTQVTLRIDSDVLEWFKAKGKGYQTQINALLVEYKKAHREP